MAKSKKNRIGVVYSTDDSFDYNYNDSSNEKTLAPKQQDLRVFLDKKRRKGKQVTLITGFVGTADDLKSLGKLLKSKCGVGGAAKDGEIMVQGDQRGKVGDILKDLGYKFKGL